MMRRTIACSSAARWKACRRRPCSGTAAAAVKPRISSSGLRDDAANVGEAVRVVVRSPLARATMNVGALLDAWARVRAGVTADVNA